MIDSLFDIKGKVCLVTGASRGIGHSTAEHLFNAGAIVCGIGRTPLTKSVGWDYRQCDVRDYDRFKIIVGELTERYGSLDALINAAGITIPANISSEIVRTRETLLVNAEAVLVLSDIASSFMSQKAVIINISSIAAHVGLPSNPSYVASKGAILSATKAMAVDLAPLGIRVNSIAPGYIRTAMTEESFQDSKKHLERLDRMLIKRWGDASDLIGAVVFFISDASSYVTGAELVVDGGWLAKGM